MSATALASPLTGDPRAPWRALGPRLVAAFVAVAVAAVAALAVLTLLSARTGVAKLVEEQRRVTTATVVAALQQAYQAAGSWTDADLRPARTLVAAAPATLQLRTANGEPVSTGALEMTNMMVRMHGAALGPFGPPRREPISIEGRVVGVADLRFPADALPGPARQLERALSGTVAVGALAAALLAAAAAMLVARRITRPLHALTAAVAAFERGDPDARAELETEITELAQLGGRVRPDGEHAGTPGASTPRPGSGRRPRTANTGDGPAGLA